MSNTPVSFSALKRSRGSVEKLEAAIKAASSNGKKEDTRFWEPTVDKSGNGYAIIRFLPAPPQDGEDGLPWVRQFTHGFQGPGGWFIDNCPTTIEQKCPVCEGNNILWNTGIESNKKIVSERKRKLSYTANILVVNDPAAPANNGTVRLFKFGKKIFDKIYEKMHPEFPDEKVFSPFDLWEGANFSLKIRKVEGYRNYDKSGFDVQSPVADDDAKLEAIWKQEHALKEFVEPKNFKSYAQLEARRVKVLGTAVQSSTAESTPLEPEQEHEDTPPQSFAPKAANPAPVGQVADEEDEDLSFFKNLADDE